MTASFLVICGSVFFFFRTCSTGMWFPFCRTRIPFCREFHVFDERRKSWKSEERTETFFSADACMGFFSDSARGHAHFVQSSSTHSFLRSPKLLSPVFLANSNLIFDPQIGPSLSSSRTFFPRYDVVFHTALIF